MSNISYIYGSYLIGIFLIISVLFLLIYSLNKIPTNSFTQVAIINTVIFHPLIFIGIVFAAGAPIQIYYPSNLSDFYISLSRYFLFSCFWILGILNGSRKFIKKPNFKINKKPLNFNGKIFSFAIAVPILIELFRSLFFSEGLTNSYLLGGDFFYEGASGLTEYIAPGLALYLISNKKRKFLFLDYLCLASGLINILLGAKSNGVIVIIFSIIRISQVYLDFDLSKSKSFLSPRFIFLSSMLSLTGATTLLNFLRCGLYGLDLNCRGLMLTISQASELINTNIAISREAPLLGFGMEDPYLYFISLIKLALPTKLTNLPAVYNPALPYIRIIDKGYHAGGGGSLDSHFIYAFGSIFGVLISFSLIYILGYLSTCPEIIFKIYKLRISSILITYVLCLLSVRFFYYDPISVVIRTFPVGILLYFLSDYCLKFLPRKSL